MSFSPSLADRRSTVARLVPTRIGLATTCVTLLAAAMMSACGGGGSASDDGDTGDDALAIVPAASGPAADVPGVDKTPPVGPRVSGVQVMPRQ
jgi:hypothetical protein